MYRTLLITAVLLGVSPALAQSPTPSATSHATPSAKIGAAKTGAAKTRDAAKKSPFGPPSPIKKATAKISEVAKPAVKVPAKSTAKVAVKQAGKPVVAKSAVKAVPKPIAAAKPVAVIVKTPAAPKLPVFLATDAPTAKNLVATISEEARFIHLRLTPETTITANGQPLTIAEIGEGMQLECAGEWDAIEADTFHVTAVTVRGRLDDYGVRHRIAEACAKLKGYRPVAPSQVAAAPVPNVATPKTDEKKPETDTTKPTEKPQEKSVEKPGGSGATP